MCWAGVVLGVVVLGGGGGGDGGYLGGCWTISFLSNIIRIFLEKNPSKNLDFRDFFENHLTKIFDGP